MQHQAEPNLRLPFPILIGDIGGTNARFSILSDSFAEPKQFPPLLTADFGNIDEAVQTMILDRTSIIPRTAVLAVAGPVDNDEVDLTNCEWVVRPRAMIGDLGFGDIILINDFEAQALAATSLEMDSLEQIGGGRQMENASRVVLGPGTGLGVAGVVHAANNWIPVPGEGGHIDIGARTARDHELFPHYETIEGRISGEQLLCGRGLLNIYRAIHKAAKTTPRLDDPSAITAAGLEGSEPAAAETLELFVTYLGRIAGDLALVFMARGGVYLSGGIPQKILPALRRDHFRKAFEDKAPHNRLLASIATFVITHPNAAMEGLAAYARTPGRFGVSLSGRHWQR